jgi:DegV family protein with EDD domain
MSIAIVTDSTSDLSPETAERHQIHVVPNVLVIDGQSLEDGSGISREEFYERLPYMKSLPTTASASAGAYQSLYEKLFKQGIKQIISLHAPSALSGIFNAASLAAQSFGNKVKVIDSGQVSLGLGFQVIAAAEAAAKGFSVEAILTEIKRIRQRVRVVAMLDTLEYVRRSGRISWARAKLGSFLELKPFIELREGKLLRLGEARTRRKGINRLLQMLQDLGPLEKLAIIHTNAEKDALEILQQVKNEINSMPILVNITTVIGTHVGPNGLGFVAVIR